MFDNKSKQCRNDALNFAFSGTTTLEALVEATGKKARVKLEEYSSIATFLDQALSISVAFIEVVPCAQSFGDNQSTTFLSMVVT